MSRPVPTFTTSETANAFGTSFSVTIFGNDTEFDAYVTWVEAASTDVTATDKTNVDNYSGYSASFSCTVTNQYDSCFIVDQGEDADALVQGVAWGITAAATPAVDADVDAYKLTAAEYKTLIDGAAASPVTLNTDFDALTAQAVASDTLIDGFQRVAVKQTTSGTIMGGAFLRMETSGVEIRWEAEMNASAGIYDRSAETLTAVASVALTGASTLAAASLAIAATLSF